MNKILQTLYGFIFIFAIGLIVAMHVVPPPALALFRVPTNLREVGPSLGLSWPTSLEVYHIFLILFFTVIILNGIGLHHLSIPKWRSVCKISSFLGLFLMWSVIMFFLYPLLVTANINTVHLKTSLIYSIFAFVFFIVSLLTFAVAQKEGKQAAGV
jgi:hypothetical protein